MNREFEIINHTADVGLVAYGADVSEVFANAAKGLFSLITELDNVREVVRREIELTAPDQESLLVGWLNELIFLFDTEYLLFKRFDIIRISQTELKAVGYGEKVDSSRHEIKIGVKAATYHMLQIDRNDGVKARIIFDI